MLKKVNRGLKRKDFEDSRANGKIYQSPLFAVSITNNQISSIPNNNQTKVGFVISKKISKKAVDRNRIKRLIAEEFRKLLITNDQLLINKKIVVLVKKSAVGAKIEEIEKCWEMIIKKLETGN